MFTWYKNYCYSRPAALRMWNSICDEPEADQWSHLDKPKKRQGFQVSGAETIGMLTATSVFSGWFKNVGKSQSNIINDSAQSAGNMIMFIFFAWLFISIADGLLRLPYFLVTRPVDTLRFLNRHLVVRWGSTYSPLVVIWWILTPLLILNMFGLLDWLGKYF